MEPFGALMASGELRADAVVDLSGVVAGAAPGPQNDEEITLCPTQGMAMWDIAIGKLAYTLALEKGIGTEFDFHAGSTERHRRARPALRNGGSFGAGARSAA